MQKRHILQIICLLFILLFAYTALSKLLTVNSFKAALSAAPFIRNHTGFFAIFIPLTELCIAFLLVIPNTQNTGLYSSLILLAMFTLYLLYIVLFVAEMPCSCGGILEAMTWTQHIVFNLACITLCFIALRLKRKNTAT